MSKLLEQLRDSKMELDKMIAERAARSAISGVEIDNRVQALLTRRDGIVVGLHRLGGFLRTENHFSHVVLGHDGGDTFVARPIAIGRGAQLSGFFFC